MDSTTVMGQRLFRVDVTFANEGEVYGGDTHYLELDAKPEISVLDMLVEESQYDDDRHPDRSWATEITEIDRLPRGAVIRSLVDDYANPKF